MSLADACLGRSGPQGQSYGKLARAGEAAPRPGIAGRDLCSLVNALYNDFRSLFVGAIAASPARR